MSHREPIGPGRRRLEDRSARVNNRLDDPSFDTPDAQSPLHAHLECHQEVEDAPIHRLAPLYAFSRLQWSQNCPESLRGTDASREDQAQNQAPSHSFPRYPTRKRRSAGASSFN